MARRGFPAGSCRPGRARPPGPRAGAASWWGGERRAPGGPGAASARHSCEPIKPVEPVTRIAHFNVSLIQPFDQGGFALPDAHAQGRQAVERALLIRRPAAHLVQQGGQDARSRAAQRMTQRNRPAVDVGDRLAPARAPCITASDCTAKASFSSTRPMSSILSPARCSALRVAGTGPRPMMRGGDARRGARRRCAPWVSGPARRAFSALISSSAAAPSFSPEEFPAVTVPFLRKAGLQACQRFQGGIAARALVGRHQQRVALLLRDGAPARFLRRTCPSRSPRWPAGGFAARKRPALRG